MINNPADVSQLRVLLGLSPNSTHISNRDVVSMAELCLLLILPDNLSPDEQITADEIIDMQITIALYLASQYETGNPDLGLPYDPAKAKKYKGLDNPEHAGQKTEKAYSAFGWFTAVRLFTVRLMRTLKLMSLIPLNAIVNNISWLTSICGLSYGIELIVETGIMLRTVFKDHLKGTRWERLKTAFWKDDRPNRFANAFIWFSVNLACFFLSGGISALLNTSLFVFDVFNDSWKAWRKISPWHPLEKNFADLATTPDSSKKFSLLHSLTRRKISDLKKQHSLQIGITLMVLTGMVFIFFPPAGLSAVIGLSAMHITGAALTLAGSMVGGLGKRLTKLLFPPKEPPSPFATRAREQHIVVAPEQKLDASNEHSPIPTVAEVCNTTELFTLLRNNEKISNDDVSDSKCDDGNSDSGSDPEETVLPFSRPDSLGKLSFINPDYCRRPDNELLSMPDDLAHEILLSSNQLEDISVSPTRTVSI